ncbi:hypothetical protein IKZ77_01790 [Candidatus Saccharibacteria bacterium]|nr:hypothetical protein [Candidatus Saccharibacteria bacterium]
MTLNFFFYDRLVFGTISKKKLTKEQVVSIVLYLLPILFFTISYFLLTTSGEDIHQGANTLANGGTLDPFGDMSRAFEHSGRITDMYAWSVIDIFDYQFSFGADTVFRLIDVAIISSALYFATYIALGRKPKLTKKDSLIFCTIFSAVIFSPFGRRLYSEFSMIHNYAPLVLITCAFALPYLKLLTGQKIEPQKPKLFVVLLLLLGFLFGMSTTITPVAVVATIIIFAIIKHKTISRPPMWVISSIIGVAIGFVISFFLSPGMNSYATNPTSAETFDYISISSIFSSFTTEVPHALSHLVYNSALVLVPLIIVFVIALIFSKKSALKKTAKYNKNLILVFSIFIVLHILATVQIKCPPRILIPAYLAGVVIIVRLFAPNIKSKLLDTSVVIITTLALIIHTVLLGVYHHKASLVLNEIKSSEESSLCIERARVDAPRIPIINLSQEFILVDWGYPEYIYNKAVTFCDPVE